LSGQDLSIAVGRADDRLVIRSFQIAVVRIRHIDPGECEEDGDDDDRDDLWDRKRSRVVHACPPALHSPGRPGNLRPLSQAALH
jgi:hypothetical protein